MALQGTVQQTRTWNTYTGGDCSCGDCSAFTDYGSCGSDWNLGNTSCCGGFCTSQPRCSRILPTICPALDGQQSGPQWDPQRGAPHVRCTYDASGIRSTEAVQTWIDTFGRDQGFNEVLMPSFCIQRAAPADCPIDPATGNPMVGCSRLSSKATDGRLCRAWAADNKPLADQAYVNYCLANDTPDCACVDRTANSFYRAAKPYFPFADGCWVVPCANPDAYLVPGDVWQGGPCPSSVCEAIINIVDSNNIDISGANQLLHCNFGPSPGPSPPAGWLWIGGGLAVLLVLGFLLIYLAARR